MIEIVNHEKFLVEVNECLRHADWHKRYYSTQARRYARYDYWLKACLGVIAVIAAAAATGGSDFKTIGSWIAAGCALAIANILPVFKWDSIVSDLGNAENEWTGIFKGYQELVSFSAITDKDEMLIAEFQRVKDLQKGTALANKRLPLDKKLLDAAEQETRNYYAEQN